VLAKERNKNQRDEWGNYSILLFKGARQSTIYLCWWRRGFFDAVMNRYGVSSRLKAISLKNAYHSYSFLPKTINFTCRPFSKK